jgi:two-component system, response regulator YesN
VLSFLLIEDDPSAVQRYRRYIEMYDSHFHVQDIACNAGDAREAFRNREPDIIFSDIQIPGALGIELLEEFRSDGWKGLAVIISGHDNFDYAKGAIKVSAVDYLLKPVFREDISALLDRLKERLNYSYLSEGCLELKDNFKPEFVQKAVQCIENSYYKDLSLHDVAECACVSESYLSSSFHKYCGMTLVDYLKQYRIQQAKKLLLYSDCQIKEIADRVGMRDASYFFKCFKKLTGTTPGEFRVSGSEAP